MFAFLLSLLMMSKRFLVSIFSFFIIKIAFHIIKDRDVSHGLFSTLLRLALLASTLKANSLR